MDAARNQATTAEPGMTRPERVMVGALAAVVFVIPLLIWPGLTDYNYTKTIASLIAIAFLWIAWGVQAWKRDGWTLRVPWVLLPVVGLFTAALLSSVHAASPRLVVQSAVILASFASLAMLTANVCRTPRAVRWIVGALAASGTLAAIYGLLQYAGILPGPDGTSGLQAVVSTVGNRNHLGGLLLYVFFPAGILLVRSRAWWNKALVLVALVLFVVTMVLVEQTSVRVGFALVTVALIVGGIIFPVRTPIRANRWWIVVSVGLLSIAVAVASVVSRPQVGSTSSSPASQPESTSETSWLASQWETNSTRVRTWDWWIGADMFWDHPLTGVGLGLYKVEFIASRADFLASPQGQSYDRTFAHASQAHNEYVQAAAEMGVLGLSMLGAVLATLAVSLWKRLRRMRDANRLDLLLLTAGTLTFLIHAVVSFPAHVVGSSLALVVLCGLALSPAYGTAQALTLRLRGAVSRIAHVALTGAALAIATFAVCDAHANALMEQGIAEIQAGRYAAGEALLQRSLAFDFAPRQTFYYLGIAQIQLGELDAAQDNLARCMTRFVDEAALLNYANLLVNTGQSDQAIEPLTVLLDSGPRSDVEPRARYLYAMAISETGDPVSAVDLIETLLIEYPKYETPYIGLGGIYASMNQWEKARQTYQAGLALIVSLENSIRSKIQRLGASITSEQMATYTAQLSKLSAERDLLNERLNELPASAAP